MAIAVFLFFVELLTQFLELIRQLVDFLFHPKLFQQGQVTVQQVLHLHIVLFHVLQHLLHLVTGHFVQQFLDLLHHLFQFVGDQFFEKFVDFFLFFEEFLAQHVVVFHEVVQLLLLFLKAVPFLFQLGLFLHQVLDFFFVRPVQFLFGGQILKHFLDLIFQFGGVLRTFFHLVEDFVFRLVGHRVEHGTGGFEVGEGLRAFRLGSVEAVVVPHFEIHLQFLTGKHAEAVEIDPVEERGSRLAFIEEHGEDEVAFGGLFEVAVEGQLGKAIVVGDQSRVVHVVGELLVVRFHPDVGVGIGEHVHDEFQGVELGGPAVLRHEVEGERRRGRPLESGNIVAELERLGERVDHHPGAVAVAQLKPEGEPRSLRNQQAGLPFKRLRGPVDVGRVGGLAPVGEERGVGVYRDLDGSADIIAADNLEGEVLVQVFEDIVELVHRSLVEQLLPLRGLDIKGVRNAGSRDLDGKREIGALHRFERGLGKADLERQRLLVLLVEMDDTLGGLHGETGNEKDKTQQQCRQDKEDPEVFQVSLQVNRIGKGNRSELGRALFDGGQQQLVVAVRHGEVCQLDGIQQLVLDIRKKLTDQQGSLFH